MDTLFFRVLKRSRRISLAGFKFSSLAFWLKDRVWSGVEKNFNSICLPAQIEFTAPVFRRLLKQRRFTLAELSHKLLPSYLSEKELTFLGTVEVPRLPGLLVERVRGLCCVGHFCVFKEGEKLLRHCWPGDDPFFVSESVFASFRGLVNEFNSGDHSDGVSNR